MRIPYNFVKNKIINNKIETYSYPFFEVKNILPQKKVINLKKVLLIFDQIVKDVLFQNISKKKKIILLSSSEYKKLYNREPIKQSDKFFRYLKPILLKKFAQHIQEYVSKEYQNSKIICHS